MSFRFQRKQFFDNYRTAFGSLQQKAVDGLEFLLGAIEKDPHWNRIEEIAYVLATVFHETARTFQPITEYRARKGTKARVNQDRYWEPYRGRGYVQLTWKRNYEKFGIADDPEKALEPETAYRILSDGMRKGVFTGKKISDYISDSEVDYVNARRVVNGLDKANLIAGYAEKFERILRASLSTESVIDEVKEPETSVTQPVAEKKEEPPVQTVPSSPPVVEIKPQRPSLMTRITAAFSALTPMLTAAGIKIGGVELSTGGLIAIASVVVVGIIVGAWVYNEGQKRALERAKLNVETLSNPHKANVVTP